MRYIHLFILLLFFSISSTNAQVINAEKEFFSKDLEKNKIIYSELPVDGDDGVMLIVR